MRIFISIFVWGLFFVNLAHANEAADLGTIVVEASRSNDTVGQMNRNVSIITSEDIANARAKSVPDLLGTMPGVYGSINSNIQDQRVDIGGFGVTGVSNVLTLVDGRRLNEPDLSGADLSNIDLNAVDHIEVVQGASTVLYGDNAAGGVINIITKKGQKNTRPSVTLSSQTDSYKTNKEGMALSGGLPKWDYQFNYDRQQSDGYRSHSDYWANDYNTRLSYNPTDIFGVDFSQGYHLDRYRLPGGLSISQIKSLGRTGVTPSNETFFGQTSDSHFDVTPHLNFEMGSSSGEFSLLTSARKRLSQVFFLRAPTDYETESYEYQPKVIISTPLTGRLQNKLTSGYDYIYNREIRRIDSVGNPEDIFHSTEVSHSVYLLDELTLDERWLLNTGVRGAWTGYVFNQTQQTAVKLDRSATTQGYDGGLGYKYNPNSKVYVHYSHSYRLPVIDEFFQSPFESGGVDFPAKLSPHLTYQVGNQYQLGVKDQSFKDINLGFNVTTAQYKNEIYFDPATSLNTNYGGRTRHYSEEAEVSFYLFNKKIEPFVNVTFQQSYFVKGIYSGHDIPFVPGHLAHAGITYQPFERLSTSLTTNFVGKRFLDSDFTNTEPKLKRYDTVDWNVKYGFKNIEIWITLKNIFDAKYFTYGITSSPGSDAYYPAPGRNLEAGAKIKF